MKVEEINFGVPLDVVGRPPSRHVAQTKKTWETLREIFPKIFYGLWMFVKEIKITQVKEDPFLKNLAVVELDPDNFFFTR